ncbi:hypothetical protein A462_23853 [Pseudomonas sp. Ag1]|nr:hypothetical protein A462_23853 [Pseudomonas sp. Ag1]
MNGLHAAPHMNAAPGATAGTPDVLGDKQLCQAGFSNTSSPQYKGVSNPLTQWQADIRFVRLYTV